MLGDFVWAVTATRGGRYAVDVPQRMPTQPPWFPEAGQVSFLMGDVSAKESAPWKGGLTEIDLTFETGGRGTRPLVEGKFSADYLRKARNLYGDAIVRFEKGRYPDVVLAVQEALELAVKAIFREAELEAPRYHQINERQFRKELLALRGVVEGWKIEGGWDGTGLARVIFYADFWAQGYLAAKYGSDTLAASPSDLFGRPEAQLALDHLAEAVGHLGRLFGPV
jgi:hypothetical protein